jgi:ribosome-associated protein
MTGGGEIVITARSFRTQEANRADARERLAELLARAHVRQQKRIKTRPSKAARAKRLDAKSRRSAVKAGRSAPGMD